MKTFQLLSLSFFSSSFPYPSHPPHKIGAPSTVAAVIRSTLYGSEEMGGQATLDVERLMTSTESRKFASPPPKINKVSFAEIWQ